MMNFQGEMINFFSQNQGDEKRKCQIESNVIYVLNITSKLG